MVTPPSVSELSVSPTDRPSGIGIAEDTTVIGDPVKAGASATPATLTVSDCAVERGEPLGDSVLVAVTVRLSAPEKFDAGVGGRPVRSDPARCQTPLLSIVP